MPKDLRSAIAFLRSACEQRRRLRGHYIDGFTTPHYILGWSGHFSGKDYGPNWGRDLSTVRAEADVICADTSANQALPPDRRDLVRQFCQTLQDSQIAALDAASHIGELRRECNSGRHGACVLGGTALALGLAAPRDIPGGEALLARACRLGSSLDCDHIGPDGEHSSTVVALAEGARVSSSARP